MPVLNQSMAANQATMAAFNQAGPSRMPAQSAQWQAQQQPAASDSTSANGSRRPSIQHSIPHSAQSGSTSATSMPTTAASLMREGPRDFTVIRDVGDGSFGTVCLADWKSPLPSGTLLSPMQHPTTRPEYIGKRLVAIKKMKKPFPNWEECMKLKELKSLLGIPAHPNIIPLYDAFLMPGSKELHFVFECMEGNLYQLTKSRKGRPLAGGLVASIFQQIVRGLHHIHVHGYFHRDMKPENLLITTTGLADYPSSAPLAMPGTPAEKDVLVIVKLADFGLARETNSRPPYTEYVSTRWYRAPEVLLRSRDYSNPVDLWALGTIMAEIVNLKPLFPGQSEVDQVLQICEVLGDPTREYGKDERGRLRGGGEWQRGIKMARAVGFEFPLAKPITFSTLFTSKVPPSLIDCIQDLLRYEPGARLTTTDLLQHHYYAVLAPRLQPPQARAVVSATTPEQQATMMRQMPREHVQSLTNVANSIAAVDAAAIRAEVPPSHSSVTQTVKPAFGAGHQPVSVPVHVLQRQQQVGKDEAAKDVAMGSLSPRGANDISDTSTSTARNASMSNYPAFPESISLQDSLQTSNAGDISMSSPAHHTETSEPDGIHRVSGLPNSSTNQISSVNSSEQGMAAANSGSPGASSESVAYKDKQRRGNKGWGLNISSVLGGGNTNRAGQQSNGAAIPQQQSTNASTGKTPAQQVIADHALTQTHATPAEAKKAKKAAEKAAREAEKAKRAAQEHAARERARAVMQKRNQMLASSNGRDQVEWLQFAENDMTRALQQQQQQQQQLQQLHMQQQQMQLQQQMMQQSSSSASLLTGNNDGHYGNAQQSMYAGNNSASHSHLQAPQSYPYQPASLAGQQYGAYSDKAWGKQPRVSHTGTSDNSSYSEHGIGDTVPVRGKLRPREGDNYGEADARRQSMQSYHTRDSDPGPVRSSMPEHMVHLGLRPETTSSLNSAPSVIDAASYRARLNPGGDRSSVDTRSVASSLDNQLILNMENMTAVDPGQRAVRQTSPTVAQYPHSARPSYSRQSHGSRTGSAHRAGSASPLHHTPAPRFHPYSSTTTNAAMASYSNPNVPLPPLSSIASHNSSDLMENLNNDGTSTVVTATRPRSKARRPSQGAHSLPRGISRGSATSRDGSSLRHASNNSNYITAPPSKSSIGPTAYYPYALSPGVGNMPVMLEGQAFASAITTAAGGEGVQTVLPPFSDFFARPKPLNGTLDPIRQGGGIVDEGMNVP
jgi:meiosis induction protein kinase IME2/SME1